MPRRPLIRTRRRHGDLTGPNSPWLAERAAYWAWHALRHPADAWWILRHAPTRLHDDGTGIEPLWIYCGNTAVPLHTGVDTPGSTIYGTGPALRALAAALLERADHYDRIKGMYAAGNVPSLDDLAPPTPRPQVPVDG